MKAKRITPLLIACALLCAACSDPKPEEKQEPTQKEKKFEFDDNSYLYLNVDKSSTMKAEADKPIPKDQNLTPQQIMKYADGIEATLQGETSRSGYAVSDIMKDYENLRFKMAPWMVIKKLPEKRLPDGSYTYKYELNETWLTNRNVTLIAAEDPALGFGLSEIIGYIPNKQMEEAEKAIRKAFAEKDSETVFKLFNDAYTFIPIREGKWNELKEKGEL